MLTHSITTTGSYFYSPAGNPTPTPTPIAPIDSLLGNSDVAKMCGMRCGLLASGRFRQMSTGKRWYRNGHTTRPWAHLKEFVFCFPLIIFTDFRPSSSMIYSQRLPTIDHPEEIHWWIKRKKPVSLPPCVDKPSEFGLTWKNWWTAMQPEWRKGDPLVKTAPADMDWALLMCGGSNGLALVVMSLSWWVGAVDAPDVDLSVAIDDVNWVLSELVATLSLTTVETGSKRPCEASPDEPHPKRSIFYL